MTGPGGAAPAPVGGGAFEVDIARAPQAIRELEQARDELRNLKNEAQSLAHVNPPARDEVSVEAAALLGQRATGGPGSLMETLDAGINELSKMIGALRSGFDAYRSNDAEGETQYRQMP